MDINIPMIVKELQAMLRLKVIEITSFPIYVWNPQSCVQTKVLLINHCILVFCFSVTVFAKIKTNKAFLLF